MYSFNVLRVSIANLQTCSPYGSARRPLSRTLPSTRVVYHICTYVSINFYELPFPEFYRLTKSRDTFSTLRVKIALVSTSN